MFGPPNYSDPHETVEPSRESPSCMSLLEIASEIADIKATIRYCETTPEQRRALLDRKADLETERGSRLDEEE
jgi:hypothetical protein